MPRVPTQWTVLRSGLLFLSLCFLQQFVAQVLQDRVHGVHMLHSPQLKKASGNVGERDAILGTSPGFSNIGKQETFINLGTLPLILVLPCLHSIKDGTVY